MLEDTKTLRLSLASGNVTGTFWVAPEMGYSLLRAELAFSGDQPFRDLFESSPRKVDLSNNGGAASECWYPATTRCRRFYGEQLVTEEVVTVTSAKFNLPVDPLTFSMKSMGIPVGTSVIEHPRNSTGSKMWDGSKLVNVQFRGDKYRTGVEEFQDSRLPFLLISVNCAVIALVIALLFLRRKFRSTV